VIDDSLDHIGWSRESDIGLATTYMSTQRIGTDGMHICLPYLGSADLANIIRFRNLSAEIYLGRLFVLKGYFSS
jgi:hypothetical protein